MPIPDSAAVHRAVEAAFRRPEYNKEAETSIWDPVWDALERAVAWLGDRLSFGQGLRFSSPLLYWLMIGTLAALAVGILGYLIWSAASRTRPERAAVAGKAASAPRATRPRGADEWDEEARRLAAEGRLREASVALYQALLLRLEKRGALRYEASKTPGDYRREVRAQPDAARTLAAFLRRFEPVAFGGRAVDAQSYEALRESARLEGARG